MNIEALKSVAMILMFLMIIIMGSIPLRMKAFKSNQRILALASAFSGGLFLSVGMLHLIPESQHSIDEHWAKTGEEEEHFPFVFLTAVLSFSLILFIEKVLTADYHGHVHSHDENPNHEEEHNVQQNGKVQVQPQQIEFQPAQPTNQLEVKSDESNKQLNLSPYILQVAVGIHAVFEGLAIGIETNPRSCLAITLVVLAHKWAEGLTLGLSFRKAEVQLFRATSMIMLQALMNPLGITIGWILSDQGELVTSIMQAISAGTFVYIATCEVIVEEFDKKRYLWEKYAFYLIAIGFVSSMWFMEQANGGHGGEHTEHGEHGEE